MQVVTDLHVHSRFSRAVSKQMVIPTIAEWARKKGIDIVATSDWTHPVWSRELRANLEEVGGGLYKAVGQEGKTPLFLLSTEVSSIYSQGGETRRIHTLIFAPNFEVIEKINQELSNRGANLLSDGRPIMGLSAKIVAEIALGVDDHCLIIPAHAWTPWYSLYGSKSGFDSISECFEELADNIYAVETGLSSDPAMNWRIAELDNRAVVSFSDAHSPQKLGREATVFELDSLSFDNIRRAIMGQKNQKIAYTIEFYPEEGKYHFTGHRKCNVIYSPNETRKKGTTCPVCGKKLTVGVMSRVESLASFDVELETEKDEFGVRWIKDKEGKKVPYVMLVPLMEIISGALSVGVASQKVQGVYEQLVNTFGTEYNTLLKTPLTEIEKIAGEKVAEGIGKVRAGNIVIKPGYDGVFGEVAIWKKEESKRETSTDQATLF